ncbi:hypothetical protein C0585_02585 [Candidatus Woesearchaeota archaeon]|nr:MAG: hypothetical protein C0585_02585 [Candidatus Woesearchaeota archaeon]
MDIAPIFLDSLKGSMTITLIILVMMIIVEILVLKYQDKLLNFAKKNRFLGYIMSAFFGIIPGCTGTFIMDSLYMTGLLGFGGIIAVMIATSGDEAFLLFSMAANGEIAWSTIILLTSTLFLLGIIGGFVADRFRKKINMKFCTKCEIVHHHHHEFKLKHFFKEHVTNHILKKHIWQIFLWLFAAIFIINMVQSNVELNFLSDSMFVVLLIASLVAVLPISGPNIFLVVMFSNGLVPFSVLLANSIIQDGHGLLPIIGFSIEDAVKIKIFNFVFGFTIGLVLLIFGL